MNNQQHPHSHLADSKQSLDPQNHNNQPSSIPPLKDSIEIVDNPRTGLAGEISSGLRLYNQSLIGPFDQQSFIVCLKNVEEQVAGGLITTAYHNVCTLHIAWVDERYRHQGVGRRLLARLFEYAKGCGCDFVVLDTVLFQGAKDFYLRMGFKVVAGYENGFAHSQHFIMRRDL